MSGTWLLSRSFTVTVLVAEAAIVAWVWRTGYNTLAAFPTALITAEGVVLTATVFVLAFSRDRFRRNGEAIVARTGQHQTAILKAYENDPDRLTVTWLFEAAREQAEAARHARLLGDESLSQLVRASRRARTLQDRRDDLERLARELHATRQELRLRDAGAHKAQALRARLTELEGRYKRLLAEARDIAENAGLAEYVSTAGRLRAELGACFETIRLAYLFVSLMVTLGWLGALYTGWDIAGWNSPEGWALVAFVGIAVSYVSVVRSDLIAEQSRIIAAFAEQPLANLYLAEVIIATRLRNRDEDADGRSWQIVDTWVDQADRELPALAWVQSLRGRRRLWKAVRDDRTHHVATGVTRLNADRNLAEAERLLRGATHRGDDPIAAVALAHVLELQMRWGQKRGLAREADALVRQAAATFLPEVDALAVEDMVRPRGRAMARDWLFAAEGWLWPTEPRRVRPLQRQRSGH